MRITNHLYVLVFLLVSSGCASVTFLPTDASAVYSPTKSIKVFWKEPQESYTIIGKVSVESGDLGEEALFNRIKQKAISVGAHAVIMGGTSQQSSVVGTPMYGGGTLIVPVSSTRLDAIAIRFIDL